MANGTWCRHYNGMNNAACEAGVNYDKTFGKIKFDGQDWIVPCLNPAAVRKCALRASYTPEEVAQQERQVAEFLTNLAKFDKRETEDCPHCGTRVEHLQQVGRCVYSRPCNCRLWQGTIPAAWRA